MEQKCVGDVDFESVEKTSYSYALPVIHSKVYRQFELRLLRWGRENKIYKLFGRVPILFWISRTLARNISPGPKCVVYYYCIYVTSLL